MDGTLLLGLMTSMFLVLYLLRRHSRLRQEE